MSKVAIHTVVAAMACLGASSLALASESALDVRCHFTGVNTVSLDIALIETVELPSENVLDLMVSGVVLEVHSEAGGFWIQLKQPVLPNLTFKLCEILQGAAIEPEETDAGRFLVRGKAFGTDEPVDLLGRCKNFPLPLCKLSE
jgi:hypothetical protein